MKNKIINILTVILILVLSTFLVFSEEIGDLDELWQYSFANNLCNGLVPYRDFNIITTPLFSFVAAIFLKIFSNQLITMRLFNLLVFSSILFIAYKIFELLKMDKIKSLLCVIILYFLFYFDLGVEYNYFILLITLIFLYFPIAIESTTLGRNVKGIPTISIIFLSNCFFSTSNIPKLAASLASTNGSLLFAKTIAI